MSSFFCFLLYKFYSNLRFSLTSDFHLAFRVVPHSHHLRDVSQHNEDFSLLSLLTWKWKMTFNCHTEDAAYLVAKWGNLQVCLAETIATEREWQFNFATANDDENGFFLSALDSLLFLNFSPVSARFHSWFELEWQWQRWFWHWKTDIVLHKLSCWCMYCMFLRSAEITSSRIIFDNFHAHFDDFLHDKHPSHDK